MTQEESTILAALLREATALVESGQMDSADVCIENDTEEYAQHGIRLVRHTGWQTFSFKLRGNPKRASGLIPDYPTVPPPRDVEVKPGSAKVYQFFGRKGPDGRTA